DQEAQQAAGQGRREQGEGVAAPEIGRGGEEDHHRRRDAGGQAVDSVGQVDGIDAADDDKAGKNQIDRPGNGEADVQKRNIEIVGEAASPPEQPQEQQGRRQLQKELLEGGEAQIPMEPDLDKVVQEADQAVDQRQAQDQQVVVDAVPERGQVTENHQ